MFSYFKYKNLAGINYLGSPDTSSSCLKGITMILHAGDEITDAKLLTCQDIHAFLLTVNDHHSYAIKSGFRSGYYGEGPRTLALALQLLLDCVPVVDEYQVTKDFILRVDQSCLTKGDIKQLDQAMTVSRDRVYEYICPDGYEPSYSKTRAYKRFPAGLPIRLIDERIRDLALEFSTRPEDALMDGYRRLEDIVRTKANLPDGHGKELFWRAFNGEKAPLTWGDFAKAELQGRIELFSGAYMAYRNPRAHRVTSDSYAELLREFLLLNHLFLLEGKATVKIQAEASI